MTHGVTPRFTKIESAKVRRALVVVVAQLAGVE
jgi:hypothetical protein